MIGYNDVFISYGRKESLIFAAKLNKHLIKNELEVWFDKDDIPLSSFYQNEIDKGIERADNFIFIIAPHSVKSKYCLLELEHAIKLNKRIIPILHVEPDEKQIHPIIQKINWIYGREKQDDNNALEEWEIIDDFDNVIQQLIKVLNNDKAYYEKHKVILSKALNWEREGKPDSFLLRGFNLELSQIWLAQGKKREDHQPLAIQEEFIKASEEKKGTLKSEVFISYSQKDNKDLAHRLNSQIQLHGITTWFDQESIATGEDFTKEINKGIEESSIFLFLISEEAITSKYCDDEIKHALKFNKKIITVLTQKVKKLPKEIAKVQWVDFVNKPFYNAFGELVRVLTVDKVYFSEMARLLGKALEWEKENKLDDLLIRGREYENAQEWLDGALQSDKQPAPSEILVEFLAESKQLFEKLKDIELYEKIKNEALKEFVKPYLVKKKMELERKIKKSEEELLTEKSSYGRRGKIEDFDRRQEINTIENFIGEGGRWHPLPAKWTGDTGVEFDYMCIHTFPCCGKQVAGDKTPSQFREDGCKVSPK